MLSDTELNSPAVVRSSGKPLGYNAGEATKETRFPTLRMALEWSEDQLMADPTFLVFGIDHAATDRPLLELHRYIEEMQRRGFDPVEPTSI